MPELSEPNFIPDAKCANCRPAVDVVFPANTTTETATVDATKLHVTFFPDQKAFSFTTAELHIWELRDHILTTAADTKEQLPWLKLAKFGTIRSEHNSLRNNKNVNAITGVEGDYDAGQMDYDTAVRLLRAARIQFLIYTSASHTPTNPRWRVLAPTSRALGPEVRSKLMARLNGVIGGIFANESFTLSQSYLYGKVTGSSHQRCDYYIGDFIDQRDDLDTNAAYKPAPRSRAANGPLTDVPGVQPDLPITTLDDARLNLTPAVRHMIVTATPPEDAPHLKGGKGHCRVIGELVRCELNNAQIKEVYLLGAIRHGPTGCPRGFDRYVERVIKLCRDSAAAEMAAYQGGSGEDYAEPIAVPKAEGGEWFFHRRTASRPKQ